MPTDSEVPNLEQLPDNGNGNGDELPEEQLEKADATKDEPEEQQEQEEEEGEQRQAEEEGQQATTAVEPNEREPEASTVVAVAKTDEELALEKQLADVQKQLAALSSLPSTIQSTLDAVTKQLAELLPTFKLQQQEKDKEQGEQEQGEQEQEPPIDEQQQQQPAEVAGKPRSSGEVVGQGEGGLAGKNYGPG